MSCPWGMSGRYFSHQGSASRTGLAGEVEEKEEDGGRGCVCARSIRQCAPVVQPVSSAMTVRANKALKWHRERGYASGVIMLRIRRVEVSLYSPPGERVLFVVRVQCRVGSGRAPATISEGLNSCGPHFLPPGCDLEFDLYRVRCGMSLGDLPPGRFQHWRLPSTIYH